MSQPDPPPEPARLRWLSEDYALLRQRARKEVWDVLIVGSGYGGAMAAAEFAGRVKPDGAPVSVCVLERGKEYAPGMFPSSLQELPAHVRVHRGRKNKTMGRLEGLLDVRMGDEVSALIGNGLGGTSLINAGVMVAPQLRPGQFPAPLMNSLTPAYFDQVKQMLGASDTLHTDHPRLREQPLRKTEELRRIAATDPDASFEHAAITVQTKDGDPQMPQCTLCGDCMTGCNVGAKKSLDTTLLAQAWGKGARIYTGATVLRVRRAADGLWLVQTNFTNESLRARHRPMAIRARQVVLAAGTLGSTEILLRSRGSALRMSLRLGHRFSCNGDNLVAVHDGKHAVHTTTDECEPLQERHVGPTITGIVRKNGFLVEEFAVPAALKRLFDETVTTCGMLHKLGSWPARTKSQQAQRLDTAAVDPQAMERTLLVGLIGHDESQWKIVLPRAPRWRRPSWPVEGQVRIDRDGPRKERSQSPPGGDPKVPQMEQDFRAAEALLRQASRGAGVLPNPLWKLLPDSMEFLVQGARGPVLTVHPLGGCPMGTSHLDGVVDHLGQVFRRPLRRGDAAGVHSGLLVLDGSIIPGSLAANPALTIAAVARHAAQSLASQWGWTAAAASVRIPIQRPSLRPPQACTPALPVRRTEVELIERLAGPVGQHWVELTVGFEPQAVADLANLATRELSVRQGDSYLRVYRGGPSARTDYLLLKEDERDRLAVFKAPLAGRLTISEPVLGWRSVWHAVRATVSWFFNRGLREIADKVMDLVKKALGIPNPDPAPPVDLRAFIGSAGRAGQQRRFDYRLQVVDDAAASTVKEAALQVLAGKNLHGSKRVTYGRRANPWKQLTELRLDGFPGVERPAVLKLDGRFLAGKGVPLLRITQQQNQIVALAEFASLGLSWARMLAGIHLWSFRAPDKPLPDHKRRRRLPRDIDGLPPRQVHWLDLEPQRKLPPGRQVKALLTQYPNPASDKPPIVLIHGYSASGNTFTHNAIPEPMARALWKDGREVWVLDLRTSSGLQTARRPWFFEDAALADIPLAIDYVRQHAEQPVDVFAHCIGAVMLSMALLTDQAALRRFDQVDVRPGSHRPRRYPHELGLLGSNIRRIVLSQKGPLLVYSNDNVLRAYFQRLLQRVVLPDGYQFSAPRTQGVMGNALDRVLSTMVYPDDEYDRENPFSWSRRARWAGFRHRMDALYARDFSLNNISDPTLDVIEELFGPLNLDTVAQAIHFARKNAITDGSGLPFDASRPALAARWPRGGTLGLHGVDNGLADVKTLEVMQSAMDYAGVPFEPLPITGYGHQDCLIGIHAARDVFQPICDFLNLPAPAAPQLAPEPPVAPAPPVAPPAAEHAATEAAATSQEEEP